METANPSISDFNNNKVRHPPRRRRRTNIFYTLLLKLEKRTYHQRSQGTQQRRGHRRRQRQGLQRSGTTFLSVSGNQKKGSPTELRTRASPNTRLTGRPMHTGSRSSTKGWQQEPEQTCCQHRHTQHGVNYKDRSFLNLTSRVQCSSTHWPTRHATPSKLIRRRKTQSWHQNQVCSSGTRGRTRNT